MSLQQVGKRELVALPRLSRISGGIRMTLDPGESTRALGESQEAIMSSNNRTGCLFITSLTVQRVTDIVN